MRAFLSYSSRKARTLPQGFTAPLHIPTSTRWGKKKPESRPPSRAATMNEEEEQPNYKEWSHENLVSRIKVLEKELNKQKTGNTKEQLKRQKKEQKERDFDPSKYSTRLIALKIAYLGKNYNGFEHHAGNTTPLPTIEEELWKALKTARLIFPKDTNVLKIEGALWDDCEYSKSGRTDKGVSAFGQVIGIKVRSSRPLVVPKACALTGSDESTPLEIEEKRIEIASPPLSVSYVLEDHASESGIGDEDCRDALDFDPILDELPYATILNRLLPPDIRVLAWCPSLPVDFSARFSCRERQYRYFFTQPAFAPLPRNLEALPTPTDATSMKDGWLDIDAMREAAQKFIGLHDFRNFCKIDGSKQIHNFERRIFYADIVEVKDAASTLGFVNGADFLPDSAANGTEESVKAAQYPKVYTFTLHGSAFLWHQVRHMISVLFLVGQGLESPSIISELLDVQSNPRRPTYELATDTPLVLWDCIFPREDDPDRKDALNWVYVGDEPGRGDDKYGAMGLMEDLWTVWRGRKIDEILAGSLIDVIHSQGVPISELTSDIVRKRPKSQKVFDGADRPRLQGKYIPVMKKPLLDLVEVVNERYATRKGWDSAPEMKGHDFRRPRKFPQGVDHMKE